MARILVVDDDPDVLQFYAEGLQYAGHEVDAYTNGFAAANRCVECRFALVVSDMQMPEIDGDALMRLIRAQRPRMPFIFISGDPDRASSGAAQSANQFVPKTAGLSTLIRTVEAVLRAEGVNAGTSQNDTFCVDETPARVERHVV